MHTCHLLKQTLLCTFIAAPPSSPGRAPHTAQTSFILAVASNLQPVVLIQDFFVIFPLCYTQASKHMKDKGLGTLTWSYRKHKKPEQKGKDFLLPSCFLMPSTHLISILFTSWNFVRMIDLINRLAAPMYSSCEATGKNPTKARSSPFRKSWSIRQLEMAKTLLISCTAAQSPLIQTISQLWMELDIWTAYINGLYG